MLLLSGDRQGTTSPASWLPESAGEQVKKLLGWALDHRPREQMEGKPQAGLGEKGSTKRCFLTSMERSPGSRCHGSADPWHGEGAHSLSRTFQKHERLIVLSLPTGLPRLLAPHNYLEDPQINYRVLNAASDNNVAADVTPHALAWKSVSVSKPPGSSGPGSPSSRTRAPGHLPATRTLLQTHRAPD